MRSLFLLLALAAGCLEASDPAEPLVASGVLRKDIPITLHRELDVLLVIDRSPAMTAHRARLEPNLRRFVEILRALPGGVPDLHLGVVTADLGDDGVLHGATGVTGRYLVDFVGADGTRMRNYDGDLADVLVRLADVGVAGGSSTQPLAAARRALAHPQNAGFLRATSSTAVYFITAPDDDSLEPVDAFATWFEQVHDDPARVIVGGVLGDATPRLDDFLARFPNRNRRASLLADDFSDVFALIAQLQRTTLGAPCLEGPLLDVDPITPGAQHACAVWYELPIGGQVLPACGDAPTGTCWRIAADPQVCPFGVGVLVLHQPRLDLPSGSHLIVECVTR